MTLVLALKCRDGAVLASDGQATQDAAGQPTRAATRKLFAAGAGVAWGAAGSVGLQQTLRARLSGVDLDGGPDERRRRLSAEVLAVQHAALRDFVAHPATTAPELDCLFCWHDGEEVHLLSVPRTGSDHQFHDRFAAIGSGDIFAAMALQPFVGAHVPLLDVVQAKLVAYKTVADAIDVAAVFLGPPIQLTVVDRTGVHPVGRDELDTALRDAAELWRVRQREALGPLAGGARAPGDEPLPWSA